MGEENGLTGPGLTSLGRQGNPLAPELDGCRGPIEWELGITLLRLGLNGSVGGGGERRERREGRGREWREGRRRGGRRVVILTLGLGTILLQTFGTIPFFYRGTQHSTNL